MSKTTKKLIPRLKQVAEKQMDVLEKYPSTPYTRENIECLDHIMLLIERAEGEHQGEHYGYQEDQTVDGGLREGHGEG